MKTPKISQGQAQVIIGVGGLLVAVIALYYTKKAADSVVTGASKVANAVNPTNNQNIINRGFNALFGLDNKTESVGTKVYDFFNSGKQKAMAQKPVDTKKSTVTTVQGTGILKALKDDPKKQQAATDKFWGQFK